jgi:hypothetical protein
MGTVGPTVLISYVCFFFKFIIIPRVAKFASKFNVNGRAWWCLIQMVELGDV